jgi:hypothetical protein
MPFWEYSCGKWEIGYELVLGSIKAHEITHLLSSVLQFDCGKLLGLWGGRLLGPSILLDISEFLSEFWLSLAPTTVVVVVKWVETPLFISDNEFCWLDPGVLDVERWFFGDDGADPTVFRVCNKNKEKRFVLEWCEKFAFN